MGKFVSSRRGQGINELRNIVDDFISDNFNDNWIRKNILPDSFKIDVEETDAEYIVHAELPGIQKDEIQLSMNEGTLTVSVEKKEETEEESKNYIHKERYFTSMSRNIYLIDGKPDNIKAKLDQGVLTVTVQKQEKDINVVEIDVE